MRNMKAYALKHLINITGIYSDVSVDVCTHYPTASMHRSKDILKARNDASDHRLEIMQCSCFDKYMLFRNIVLVG